MNKPDELLLNMGSRIIQRRKYLGLSQEKLAELADVSPQLLSTAERGTKALRPENLLKISRALGVSTDYLLTGDVIDTDLKLISDKLSGVTPLQVRTIEQIIDCCLSLSNPD